MPAAGPLAEDRAHAHYRWAERYHSYGDHEKAAAHFGRALEYSYNASFGGKKRKTEEVDPDVTFDDDGKRHLAGCRVCKERSDLNWYRDKESGDCYRLCPNHARDFLEDEFVKEDIMCAGILSRSFDRLGVGYPDTMEEA
jgi:hypothetical protein